MPRSIIDTESSRPAYQRRLAIRWIIVVALLAAALVVGVRFWQATAHKTVNLAPIPHYRREYAA
jgi:predicted negative regulator of RcsB-dependent stress response